MSDYRVIDAEQLDSDLTILADAIRSKGGTSEQLSFPQGMVSAVEAISSGDSGAGENVLLYATGAQRLYENTSFPSGYEITLELPNFGIEQTNGQCKGLLSYVFYKSTGVKKVCFKGNDKNALSQLEYSFHTSDVEIIDFSDFTLKPSMVVHCFRNCTNLTAILGEFDLSECTSLTIPFDYSNNLKELRFKPNTIKLSISLWSQSQLTDETIQSVIDGLADLTGSTAQTVTFNGAVKSKLTDEQKAAITNKNWTLG